MTQPNRVFLKKSLVDKKTGNSYLRGEYLDVELPASILENPECVLLSEAVKQDVQTGVKTLTSQAFSEGLRKTPDTIHLQDKMNIIDIKIDANKASLEELKYIKGVSDAMAQKIIENRPYESIAELDKKVPYGKKSWNTYNVIV